MAQVITRLNQKYGKGRLILIADADANDASKSITNTSNLLWEVISVYVSYVSSADVGNRQFEIQLKNGSDMVWRVQANAVQAAGATERYLAAGNLAIAEPVTDLHTLSLPVPALVPEGMTLHILDSAAVADGADDLTVAILAVEYDIRGTN